MTNAPFLPATLRKAKRIGAACELSGLRRTAFGHPDELPIPSGLPINKYWTRQMIEMADHIGTDATLRVVDSFGGEYLYIAIHHENNKLRGILDAEAVAKMSHVYSRERIRVPCGKGALRYARRQPVIAAIRSGAISTFVAARILRTSQTRVSYFLNWTDDGVGVAPLDINTLRAPAFRSVEADDLLEEAASIVADALGEMGADDDAIERAMFNVMQLGAAERLTSASVCPADFFLPDAPPAPAEDAADAR